MARKLGVIAERFDDELGVGGEIARACVRDAAEERVQIGVSG